MDFNYFMPYFGALEPDWLQPEESGLAAAAAAEDVAVAQAAAQRLKADVKVRSIQNALVERTHAGGCYTEGRCLENLRLNCYVLICACAARACVACSCACVCAAHQVGPGVPGEAPGARARRADTRITASSHVHLHACLAARTDAALATPSWSVLLTHVRALSRCRCATRRRCPAATRARWCGAARSARCCWRSRRCRWRSFGEHSKTIKEKSTHARC